jgi:alkane 1-monooxygenase
MSHSSQAEANGLGFLLSFAGPALLMVSAVLGRASGWPNAFASLPLAVAFAVVPLLSAAGINWAEPPPIQPRSNVSRLYYRLLPVGAVPAQLVSLAFALDFWTDRSLDTLGRIAWLLSTGTMTTLFAVTVAHELIHRRNVIARALGGILLSTACFGVFKIVHLRIHHRFVCTDRDFASARRGDSLYGFWLRGLVGYPREALRCERVRLHPSKRPLWNSELVVWYAISLLLITAAVIVWGWIGGMFFLLQSLVAILMLDWTNYVQHYGLRRRADADGRLEPVRPDHAWSIQCRISNLALLNLLRHGDHHARPLEPYHRLVYTAEPTYPYPLGFMMLLALATPLFRRVVHPLLDQLTVVAEPSRG